MAKSDFPESWAGVAEPLRALIAEVARETDGAAAPDLATVSVRWAQVRDAVHSAVRARIVRAQAAHAQSRKRNA
ncbi:MAG TPA: hypothetical protein VF469_28395 [Kofleriaceae bacterium]